MTEVDAVKIGVMKYFAIVLIVVSSAFAPACLAQNPGTIERKNQTKNLDDLLERYNTGSVPYISVEELRMDYGKFLVLDTRQLEEYEVSHLPGAIWVGDSFDGIPLSRKREIKNSKKRIIVYCSVGIRSEDFGEEMRDQGFQEVYNLYGSIFAWKDAGYEVVDLEGKSTERVHVYGKKWAEYLKSGIKVY